MPAWHLQWNFTNVLQGKAPRSVQMLLNFFQVYTTLLLQMFNQLQIVGHRSALPFASCSNQTAVRCRERLQRCLNLDILRQLISGKPTFPPRALNDQTHTYCYVVILIRISFAWLVTSIMATGTPILTTFINVAHRLFVIKSRRI